MITTRTALTCAMMCLILGTGGCGLFNSDRDQLAADLKVTQQELTKAKDDAATANLAAKAKLKTTKDELGKVLASVEKKLTSLQTQLTTVKGQLVASKNKATAAEKEQSKAKAAVRNAKQASANLARANKALVKANTSLKKSIADMKNENDGLRNKIISYLAQIAELKKTLGRTNAAKPAK